MNKSNYIIARRYATAALQTVAGKLTIDEVLACKHAAKRLSLVRQWLVMIDMPGVESEQKKRMLDAIMQIEHLPGMLKPLIDLLHHDGRIDLLPEVLYALAHIFFIRHSIKIFRVKSAPVLDDEQRNIVRDFLKRISKAEYISCEFVEDVALIAGIRAESETALWEYSVDKKLREAQQMVNEDAV